MCVHKIFCIFSYICYIGVIDKIVQFFTLVRDSYPETNGHVTDFVVQCLSFIGSLSEVK